MPIRGYKCTVVPNERKKKLLEKTYSYLQEGSDVFFDFFLSLYGGITPKMIPQDLGINEQVICAVNWFKIVEKTKDCIADDVLLNQFAQYYGENPNEEVVQFLTASYNKDKYVWVDCRQKFYTLQKDLGVQNLENDLECLIREDLLPVGSDKEVNGWHSISKLFGCGEKEDRTLKAKVLNGLWQRIEKDDILTEEDARNELLHSAGVLTPKEFRKVYKGAAGGRDCYHTLLVDGRNFTFNLKTLIKQTKDKLKEKSVDVEIPNKEALRLYLEKRIGRSFEQRPWSEMYKTALSAVMPKNTLNYGFAIDRHAQYTKIQTLKQPYDSAITALNRFFESECFTGSDVFVISPSHLGKTLKKLYNYKDVESGISEIIEDEDNSLRSGVNVNLLRYIFTLKDVFSAEDFIKAAEYNVVFERYNRQKVHPTVKGNQSFTFGNSALSGKVIPPSKCLSNLPGQMWLAINLLDQGEWKEHHIPFHNARFYEEIYATSDNQNNPVDLRTKRFGCSLNKTFSAADIEKVKESAKKKHGKAAKRILRAKNTNTAVNWVDCGFMLEKTEVNFKITVNYKLPDQKLGKFEPIVGTKILAYDQNQTAPDAYAILEICDDSEAFDYKGYKVKCLSTGDLVSKSLTKQTEVDQLSYRGVDKTSNFYKKWKQQRRLFIKSLNVPDALNSFENINKEYLYGFNNSYMKLLKQILRGKFGPILVDIRPELIEMCQGIGSIMRLSSLNHDSLDAIQSLKSLLHSYFDLKVKEEIKTEELREKADKEVFKLLQQVIQKQKNKRKEKVNRTVDAILTLAVNEQVQVIVGEGDLCVSTKGTKKRQNNRTIDWCARAVVEKLEKACKLHGLHFKEIPPHYTSHQDCFEHNKDIENPKEVMKCRFNSSENVAPWMIKKFANYLKCETKYYVQGMQDFLEHYGLVEYKDHIKKGKIQIGDFQKLIKLALEKVGEKEIVFPCKGGRIYLSTHCLTNESKPIVFNGRRCYVNNADHVAAINVGICLLNFARAKVAEKTP